MKKLLMSVAVLAMSSSFAFADTIRMGTEGAYEPYNFINDAGEVDGLERAVGDELCKRAGLTCEWVTNDWDTIIPNLVSGNYDTIIAGMSITDERDAVIDFTQDYVPPTPSAMVAAADDVDLGEAIFTAQTNTIQSAYVAESGSTLVEFATADETIAAVKNGEADVVLADRDYLTPIVEQSGGALVFVGPNISIGGGVGMGLRESDGELREKFNTAISSMKADGTLNALLIEWLGEGTAIYE